MRWEYLTVDVGVEPGVFTTDFDYRALNERMNELGKDGWELVSGFDLNASRGATKGAVLFFKRPMEDSGDAIAPR